MLSSIVKMNDTFNFKKRIDRIQTNLIIISRCGMICSNDVQLRSFFKNFDYFTDFSNT